MAELLRGRRTAPQTHPCRSLSRLGYCCGTGDLFCSAWLQEHLHTRLCEYGTPFLIVSSRDIWRGRAGLTAAALG